jgi:hypothetical protein
VQLRIEYSYGRTAVVVEPTADEIDRTPNVAEEALRAYTDTPIVAPAVVPAGLELDVADLLSPAETLEGCTQVSLDYEPAPDGGVDFLQLFVVPRECAEAFDPTPYDEMFGGLPSRRVQLLEVLVGDSVVQLDSSLADADLEAIVRTLTPLTADEVIAMVAPS